MAQDFMKWIEDIDIAMLEDGFELNDWESEFYESIKTQIEDGRDLSQKQIDCIEKIHQKATEGETYR